MTALVYEQFMLPTPPLEVFIERVPADKKLPGVLARWKEMQRGGWDLTVLVAPDSKTVVALGCRGDS